MDIKIVSVDSVIIYFGNSISKEVNNKVKNAYQCLKNLDNNALIEMIPSYNSLFITYDIFKYDFDSIKKYLQKQLENNTNINNNESKLITIDVYYGLEVGLDLQRVATLCNITIEELIKRHSQKVYDVYTIGFLPGFAYLGEVDETIYASRLETPRKKIPKNSVSIAKEQTAIYPIDSPGGWNILGKTAFDPFDKNHPKLSSIDINTQIKFNPITKDEFISQGGEL